MDPPAPVQYNGSTFIQVRSYVGQTSLQVHLQYFTNDVNVVDVERHFRRLIRGIDFWEIDRTQEMFTTLCMLILVKGVSADVFCHKRCNLMVRFMQFVDCVTPMTAHLLIEYLLKNLEDQQLDTDGNILKLASQLSELGCPGRVFGVCLLWSLLARHLPGLDVTMNRFREPGEIVEAIRQYPPIVPNMFIKELNVEDIDAMSRQIDSLSLVLDAMDRVLTLVLYRKNEDLILAGYPHEFFAMDKGDSNFLSQWCLDVADKLPDSMYGPNAKFGTSLQNIIGVLIHNGKETIVTNILKVDVDIAMNANDVD